MNKRREFIKDVVDHYIENYPDEYKAFNKQTDIRRIKLSDKKLGSVDGDKTKDIRLAVSLPTRLHTMISVVLDGDEEKRFCDDKGELKWFAKKFPQFLIPNEY